MMIMIVVVDWLAVLYDVDTMIIRYCALFLLRTSYFPSHTLTIAAHRP